MWSTTGVRVGTNMLAEINRLRGMTVAQLQARWLELYGEPSRSHNKDFLYRRLAWRLQELQHGGLSQRAKDRLAELAPTIEFTRARTPTATIAAAAPTPVQEPPPATRRDPRLPASGSVITRQWHGRELRLLVLDDGFELDGTRYGSLSEAARAVTGQRWNGPLFFGLRKRSRGK